jgi:L-2-hydroxyglutarate oxidase LhgO
MGTGRGLDYDVAVVGAGIVGLATSAKLASPSRPLLLLERHDGICRETSSRNSEVVHAGLYYERGSLKARACVRGRRLLYERCDRLGIAAPRIGKLVVAADSSELPDLEELYARARENDVEGLRLVDRRELASMEPQVRGVAAMHSPVTGILDSHAFAASLLAEAEAGGADAVFRASVVGAAPLDGGGYALRVEGPDGVSTVTARRVVNAAGLGQPALSEAIGIDLDEAGLRNHPCKGVWFKVADRHRGRLNSLVYPVVKRGDPSLGVHICIDVAGGLKIGPDLEWIDGPPFDLEVDPGRRDAFYDSTARLFPWLERDDLSPDMAGVRAKLLPGRGWVDFVVREECARGLPGWLTLAGIESPGLTASMALAEEVAALLP